MELELELELTLTLLLLLKLSPGLGGKTGWRLLGVSGGNFIRGSGVRGLNLVGEGSVWRAAVGRLNSLGEVEGGGEGEGEGEGAFTFCLAL